MMLDIKMDCDKIITGFLDTVNEYLYDMAFNKLDAIYQLDQKFSESNSLDEMIETQYQYYIENYFPISEDLEDLLNNLNELSDCDHHKTNSYVEQCIAQFEELRDNLEDDYSSCSAYTDFKLFISATLKECVSELPTTFKHNVLFYSGKMYYIYLNSKTFPEHHKKIDNLINTGYFISKK